MDLTNATNLEKLYLDGCESLVEIPSSFSHLQKLDWLDMAECINLQVIPPHLNLASLNYLNMFRCTKLRNFPAMSTHISNLTMSFTAVKDVPASTRLCSRLYRLYLSVNTNLKEITHLPRCLIELCQSYTEIEEIPESIKDLHQLSKLYLSGCKRLTSLPELPRSLTYLSAYDCESLETVLCPFNTPNAGLCFLNCFKLDQQTQRAIIQRSFGNGYTRLPGREVPAEFEHRARGNSLTIRLDGNMPLHVSFMLCLVVSPNHQDPISEWLIQTVLCRRIVNGHLDPNGEESSIYTVKFRKEHLFIFDSKFRYFHSGKVSSEVVFEFSCESQKLNILECGAMSLNSWMMPPRKRTVQMKKYVDRKKTTPKKPGTIHMKKSVTLKRKRI
uniref:Putative disease resistance protein n=1 Tax=Noccaea caerulescens TaxID=107243 RepID=A0A1J3FUN3_NOCCA